MVRYVYAIYDSRYARLASLWARSWMSRGWVPRFLSPNDLERSGGSAALAARHRHGRRTSRYIITSMGSINFSYWPKNRGRVIAVPIGTGGWDVAKLVHFQPGDSDDKVYNCGRWLCLSAKKSLT